jgi:hypothetical protein
MLFCAIMSGGFSNGAEASTVSTAETFERWPFGDQKRTNGRCLPGPDARFLHLSPPLAN